MTKKARITRDFGMSSSGFYRTPYKSESVIKGLLTCTFVLITATILIFAIKTIIRNLYFDSTDILVGLVVSIIALIIEAIVAIVWVVSIKKISGGYKCRYTDDGERFTTDEGGIIRQFYYWEVKEVIFIPRTTLGKVRGYKVCVLMERKTEEFYIASEGFISKESTPFYIVAQRVDEYQAKKARGDFKYLSDSDNPATPKISSDGTVNRLGMDAKMPEVTLPSSSPNKT